MAVSGAAADHALAFDRGGAVTVVTRMPLGLSSHGGWGDTTVALYDGTWRDVVSGRTFEVAGGLAVGDLLTALPVALLVREDA